MASLGDLAPLERQLILTNLAESSESCYFVYRISLFGKILDDADVDAETRLQTLSEAHQQVLNWQTSSENLQNDDGVSNTLMQESGRLCPCKSFSFAFFSKVKSDDDSLQRKLGEHPLSAYEQISFRTAMLTKHSAVDGSHPELLARHDGLGGERSFLRWRSHDYVKVTLCKPRECFRVFWLIQWDIVGKLRCAVAPEPDPPKRSPARIGPPLRRPHPTSQFHNVRFGEKRKLRPWIAEVRRKGERKKIWLGSYKTKEAAARAADVANHYHNRGDLLNFKDSPTNLEPVPLVLSEKGRLMFVKKEAKRIARLSETQPSVVPHNLTRCIESFNDARNSTAGNMQQPEAFDSVRAASDHVQVFTEIGGGFFPETVLLPKNLTPCTTCTESSIDGCNSALGNTMQQSEVLELTATADHVKVFTGYGGDVVFPETGGSSLEATQNVWPSTPPGSSFVSALSPGSPPLIGQAHMYPNSFSPESFNIPWGGLFVGMDFTEFDEDNGDWEDVVEGLFNH